MEESQLASQAAFLHRSCEGLRGQCQSSEASVASERHKVDMLTSDVKQLEAEIAAMRNLDSVHRDAETQDSTERSEAQVIVALEHRNVADEYASLERTHAQQ